MTSRKKPGVAFWTTVMVVVVVLYPLSIGPLVGLLAFWGAPNGFNLGQLARVNRFYTPVYKVLSGSESATRAYAGYVLWSARTGEDIGKAMKR